MVCVAVSRKCCLPVARVEVFLCFLSFGGSIGLYSLKGVSESCKVRETARAPLFVGSLRNLCSLFFSSSLHTQPLRLPFYSQRDNSLLFQSDNPLLFQSDKITYFELRIR